MDGKAVMGDGGKEIFLISNGTRRNFPDYQTFLDLQFHDKLLKVRVCVCICNNICGCM
jgi:hypothetical protein